MIRRTSHHLMWTVLPELLLLDSFASTVTRSLKQTPNPLTTLHPSLEATHSPPLRTVVLPEQLKQLSLPPPEQVPQLASHDWHEPAELS